MKKSNKKNISAVFLKSLIFLCGEKGNGKFDRSVFWSMLSTVTTFIVLLFAYFQLRDVKKATSIAYHQLQAVSETTSADFSLRIKSDLITPEKMRLISLFDNDVLIFKSGLNESIWFELDTIIYHNLSDCDKIGNVPFLYNILEVDELLQDFEDLSFYEKKGQINIDYIYDRYAYYIEMLWKNKEIKKYVQWQRSIPHFSNTYINFELMYNRLKARTDQEK